MATATEARLDQLPYALLATIMTKLDVASICSLSSTCSTFRSCAKHILSFLPNFHLIVTLSIHRIKSISLSRFSNFPNLTMFVFLFFRILRLLVTCSRRCSRLILTWRASKLIVAVSMNPRFLICWNRRCMSFLCSIVLILVGNFSLRSVLNART